MNKIFSRAVLGAALLAVSGFAAASTSVVVDSRLNSIVGGAAKDSGVFLAAGESFSVVVAGNQTWNNSGSDPAYLSDADGHPGLSYSVGSFTADIGSLVADIGGTYLQVGKDYAGVAPTAGALKFFYWDSDAWNNVGAVTATVSAVPEPANIALVGLALGAFALTRRRKA